VWPALVVATLLLAFVVGAALTKRPLQQYYSFEGGWSPYWYSFDTLTYNLASNAFGWHTRVRDVFAGNPMNAVMNGSLWSLRFEIALYVVLGGIALCVRYRIRRVAFLGLAVTAALYLLFQTFGWIPLSHGFWVLGNYDLLISVALYFFLGVATYAYRDWIPFSPTSALILALVAILASVTSFDSIIAPVAITYFIACIGASPFASGFDRRFGDYSYGTYIYAWPVQQAAVTIFSIASPYVLLAVALPATLGVAFVSWHLIEAPALRLKRRIGPIPTRSHIPVPAASK
jgi:peptidoglycan/LPS O-acetylase OafA/YrhL